MAVDDIDLTLDKIDGIIERLPPPPRRLYLALHSGDPLDGASEISGGGYARQPMSFEPHTMGVVNAEAVTFTNMPACRVTHFGIWNDPENGALLLTGRFDCDKQADVGCTITMAEGAFSTNMRLDLL